MRLTMAAIAAGVILALVLPFGAEAGGNGAVRAPIYEGAVYDIVISPTLTIQRTYATGDEVGFAILNATKDDTMSVMVKIQDGLPDTEFQVTIVPGAWNAGTFSLTTDGKGKGSLTIEVAIPANYVALGTAPIKVILTSADDDIYVTDDRKPSKEDPPFTNPPADDLSTTHSVNLK